MRDGPDIRLDVTGAGSVDGGPAGAGSGLALPPAGAVAGAVVLGAGAVVVRRRAARRR
ncbi:hypothetical protein NHG22_07900 [Streptomyces sp. ATE26]|uniref:hypothetical protein n=1 Tax=Streptomyces sp. ATE26 TaxID=2954237 RepID=UPI002482DDA2|nr:hypothetical protein [Streptomyces sp. ATE26]MDI1453734.1 hypothetical protein [Streptomyces sp. ATE26]